MEYLSDGISESLINSLSQLPGMKVIARSSSFKYKGKNADPQEVAKALGVQAVVSGRAERRGNQLVVSVDVVDAGDNSQLRGEQYHRYAEGLLAVQSEISSDIAEKLRLRLSAGDRRQLAKRETANPQAYEQLLMGRFHWRKGGTDEQKKAVEYLKQAIAVDPSYALAHAELSVEYSNLVLNGLLDPKVGMPMAEEEARTALRLDESLADAHLALANLKMNAWDWAAARYEYERAVELNPNLAEARRWYANHLTVMRRSEQAVAEIRRARELDPLSLPANADVGFHLIFARRYDEAMESLGKTVKLDENYPITYIYLGYAYAAKEKYRDAIFAYNEAIKRGQGGASTQIYLGAALAGAGEREQARAILKRLQTSADYVSPAELATLYAALGEREQAFASLERAYAAHDLQLQYLGGDPTLESLRFYPRYDELLRLVGLPY
jgi:TolB-like protein/Tfp pilus assembly protein PilF